MDMAGIQWLAARSILVALLLAVPCKNAKGLQDPPARPSEALSRKNPCFILPIGITVAPDGGVFVTDLPTIEKPGLIRVDPESGESTLLASGGNLVWPVGVAVASNGDVFVLDNEAFGGSGGIFRVDPKTGEQQIVTRGDSFSFVTSLTIDGNGDLWVTDWSIMGGKGILRVDPRSGQVTVLGDFGFTFPSGMAVSPNGDLLVVDCGDQGGMGAVYRIQPITGARTLIASGQNLVRPRGIGINPDGSLVVSDDGAFGGKGGIIRIDAATGAQAARAAGFEIRYPSGIAVDDRGRSYVVDYTRSGTVVRFEHESAEPPVASLENPVEVEERHSQIANLALVLRDGRKLSAQEAERLEQSLEREPEDLASRARLLAYYFSGSIKDRGAEAKIAARRRHILWLVQHHPESELAGTSVASLDRSGHVLADAEGYEKARQLWIESASRADADSSVLLNAARFFRLSEKPRAETYLLRGREQRRTEPEFSLALGHLYALAILGTTMTNQNGLISRADPIEANSEFAQRARAALQQSEDAALLGSAGYLLMFQGAMLARLGQIESDPSALAQQCIARAKALDPQNPAHASTMAQFYQTQAKASQSAEEKMEWWRKALVELEQAVELTPDPEERFSRLTNLTKNAFEAGELAKAETRANQLLALAAEFRSSWNYGNAVHHGNLVIGRILLRRGEIEAAKRRLLEAGGTPGSAQLDSFGPNMSLAKELLERGEKEIVLGYFQRCASFWKMDYGKLARWRAEVEAGRIPNFGANLLY